MAKMTPEPLDDVAALDVRVAEAVLDEVAALRRDGADVAFADPEPRFRLPAARQAAVDRALDERVPRPGFADWLFDPRVHPAGHAWWGVAKRAVALHTLHHVGEISRPAEGIESDAYDRPLFGGGTSSARELMRAERGDDAAARILARYDRFLGAPELVDGEDEYGLTSYDYLLGVPDSHAVRTRGDAALDLLREHVARDPGRPVHTVSVACAAAGPLFDLAQSAAGGTTVERLTFVDHDPLALASVASLARGRGLGDSVSLHRKNILKTPMASYLAPQSADVVDLIGLFEHLPTSRMGYRLASALLADARAIVRPGGLILLGNMLVSRPRQDFFDSVWPALQQRTIRQTLALVAEAGLPLETVKVRVPRREGVYAVYAIEVPSDPAAPVRASVVQSALRRLLTARMPEY